MIPSSWDDGKPRFKADQPSRLDDATTRERSKTQRRQDVYRKVDQRDRYRCRAYGTPADPYAPTLLQRGHHHHVQFRSQGGNDTTANLCLLSPTAHDEVHKRILFISGNADKTLRFKHTKTGKVWRG
jgi:hypothetical protein